MGNFCQSQCNQQKQISIKQLPKNPVQIVQQVKAKNVSFQDFIIEYMISKNLSGRIFLVTKKSSLEVLAMKVIDKDQVKEANYCIEKLEQKILQSIRNPFIVKLKYDFYTSDQYILVIEACLGGELYRHRQKNGKFSEEAAKFYMAQLLIAINYLHSNQLIYRNLNPSKILIDKEGNAKVINFQLLKVQTQEKSFQDCENYHYFAPEILLDQGYTKAADYWSLGVIFYEMLHGVHPFANIIKEPLQLNEIAKTLEIDPSISTEASELIKGLLTVDQRLRLQNFFLIKNLQFFKDIDWIKIEKKKVSPPIIPDLQNDYDIRYLDEIDEDLLYIENIVQEDWQYNQQQQNQNPQPNMIKSEEQNSSQVQSRYEDLDSNQEIEKLKAILLSEKENGMVSQKQNEKISQPQLYEEFDSETQEFKEDD